MIEIYSHQMPDVYVFIKSLYVGLAKIPRCFILCILSENKIMESLYFGGGGGALWDSKNVW